MVEAGTAERHRDGGLRLGGERHRSGTAVGASGAERHEIVGQMVVRGVRAALDSLQGDLLSTARVVAIGELRELLRLLAQRSPMRAEQAASYVELLVDCALGRDAHNPERCAVVVGNRWCWTEPQLFAALDERARQPEAEPRSCEEPWIDTAPERARRLGEGAAPHLLAEPADVADDPDPDARPRWLARLSEAFPPGAGAELPGDWAGVSRRLAEPYRGEHRIATAPSRIRALGALAAGVADGWLPVLLVDLRSGVGWRVSLVARGDRVVAW